VVGNGRSQQSNGEAAEYWSGVSPRMMPSSEGLHLLVNTSAAIAWKNPALGGECVCEVLSGSLMS